MNPQTASLTTANPARFSAVSRRLLRSVQIGLRTTNDESMKFNILVGMDVVEVAPVYDSAEITSLASAKLAAGMLCLFAAKSQHNRHK